MLVWHLIALIIVLGLIIRSLIVLYIVDWDFDELKTTDGIIVLLLIIILVIGLFLLAVEGLDILLKSGYLTKKVF